MSSEFLGPCLEPGSELRRLRFVRRWGFRKYQIKRTPTDYRNHYVSLNLPDPRVGTNWEIDHRCAVIRVLVKKYSIVGRRSPHPAVLKKQRTLRLVIAERIRVSHNSSEINRS